MDHEYDAQGEDDRTKKTPAGLDSPPNGPSAAHFREAARLAAARARKALERTEERSEQPPAAKTTPVVADDFKTAAGRHARSMSGRSKIADMKRSRVVAEKTPRCAEESLTSRNRSAYSTNDFISARMLRFRVTDQETGRGRAYGEFGGARVRQRRPQREPCTRLGRLCPARRVSRRRFRH